MKMRYYYWVIGIFLVLSYSVYFIFDGNTVAWLGMEDGVFEYVGALSFLGASIFFMLAYRRNRIVFYVLLAIVMFVGFGEEISWGQRIIGFATPALIEKVNVQGEFSLHNIELFNGQNFDGTKPGLALLLRMNFLYKVFWLGFGVLLPIAIMRLSMVKRLSQRMRLPIPPLSIGIFFLVNWLIFRILLSFVLPPNETSQYYHAIGEISECGSAFIFMMIGYYFFNKERVAEPD